MKRKSYEVLLHYGKNWSWKRQPKQCEKRKMGAWMDGWTEVQMDAWTNWRRDGEMNGGRVEGVMDGFLKVKTNSNLSTNIKVYMQYILLSNVI